MTSNSPVWGRHWRCQGIRPGDFNGVAMKGSFPVLYTGTHKRLTLVQTCPFVWMFSLPPGILSNWLHPVPWWLVLWGAWGSSSVLSVVSEVN